MQRFVAASFCSLVLACSLPAAAEAVGAHGLRLPATFRGDLPCADCEAIRYHLDLWPDQVFHLRREWKGRNLVRDEVGRWQVDPARGALILQGGGEMPLQFAIQGDSLLRALDLQGRPIESTLPYELTSEGTLEPTDLTLSMGGELTYMADAARFVECLTGRSYPVAMEADFVKLQTAYRESAPEPGAPLYVTFDGSLTDRPGMERGIERTIVVNRFINAWPGQRCERARAQAPLVNTYWRIVRFGDEVVQAEPNRREPHLLLHADAQTKGYRATVGCNTLAGPCSIDGDAIRFGPAAATLMACPPPLDAIEKRLGEVLSNTRRLRVNAQTLELFGEDRETVTLLEAVYF